jgi:CheY-like chemotaxis protein
MTPTPVCFLIDDDLDDQEIFSLALQQVNPFMECIYANDGIYGLKKLKEEPYLKPGFIFIDINMPRMNGIECLKEIKKIGRLRDIPVYMYSTAADMAIINECKKLGATDFIKKSPAMSDLENTLSAILSNQKLPDNHDGNE